MLPSPPASATKQEIMDRVGAVAPRFAERAAAAEEARRIPQASVDEMLDAGFARILIPKAAGGYGLGFDTWFEVTRELCKADASHGWCASLIIHHNHLIAQYPEIAQKTLWVKGPDVPIAASFAPAVRAVPVDGGYRISGKGSPFASGVDHCTWVILGGMAQDTSVAPPEWKFFLVPPGDYTVRDTWFTAGMRGTGSKTIVTDNAFVPSGLVLKLTELRDGKTPGGSVFLLCAYRVCDANAGHRPRRLRALPRMDQRPQGARRLIGRREDVSAGTHGARRRRSRRRRLAIAPCRLRHRHADRLLAGPFGAFGARLRPRLRADRRRDRRAGRAQRYHKLQHVEPVAARVARHSFHVHAHRGQHRDEFRPFRPHGAWARPRRQPAVVLGAR